MKQKTKNQLRWIFKTMILIGIGMVLFKYVPMHIYGKDILFDASSHMAWTSWGLYVGWFFIDQNKSWRSPYLILSALILIIMGVQRIISHQHDEVGVILGLVVAFFAITIPRWSEFKKRLKF